ncbi:hypothetical protein FKM82_024015, partial [Ascaphus truei]
MAISATLTNYYVDSIISHESDESPAAKVFSGQYPSPRPPGHTDHLDFPSCSFQPKAPVFSATWAPLNPHTAAAPPAAPLPSVYHPYIQQGAPTSEGRYLRGWLEPLPRAESGPPPGQGAVKAEPQLGSPEYSTESSAGRDGAGTGPRPSFPESKGGAGSEDKGSSTRPDPS